MDGGEVPQLHTAGIQECEEFEVARTSGAGIARARGDGRKKRRRVREREREERVARAQRQASRKHTRHIARTHVYK
jgi:hypothetical protein